ncbi:hypothetical protein DV737_g681, partial [Chaetothyriales sp. CBS 132003]
MAPSPTARRLLKETAELSTSAANPAPAFYAQPISDADLHEWHFTLLGPPSPSPYAGGLYHGRITLPPQYPLKPPNFRFLTPSGRFEVNREICLSISRFHEETWMPAWGVRTALTALRTFMAEQGTTGQVGGLEAPADVRKRMAGESRAWRCEVCGHRSNEEIMTEWWQSCRQRGVDVGVEWLPDGISDGPAMDLAKSTTTIPTQSVVPLSSTPTPEQIQSRAEAVLTPSEQAASSDRHRMLNFHTGPLVAATRTVEQQLQREQRELRQQQPTLTIDRAIAGVFVALVIMLLKKAFYPGRSPGPDYIDGGGGYHLEREF